MQDYPSRSRAMRLAALAVMCVFSLAILASTAAAQDAGDSTLRSPLAPRVYPVKPEAVPRPSARAVRVTGPIEVDGRLDEPAWMNAQPLGDFVQQLPVTGQAATFPTIVRVMYDETNVYVGATLYDPEPSKAITAGLERDFNSGNSDIFGVVFDTFLDRRNSFLFLVNPKGAVRDEQTWNDSRNIVEAWEGVIFVKTAVSDSSWTVEMRIPSRTLRFDASRDPQAWGVNFIRRVRRVNETSYWAPLERQHRVHRMSRAGTIDGFDGLRQGRNLQLKPYSLGGHSSGAQVAAASLGSRFNAGLDLKYGVTPQLTLDLTTRTDFSQVEVDQEQVNLTRFSLFFPERREFFIENSGSFTFGDVTERSYRMGASLSDFTLFNSRRIGLTGDGRAIPILGGGRLTGRAAGWEVGLLDMQTQRLGSSPAENFAVARVKRNVFGNSDIGLVLLNREATDSNTYNRSYGLDANVRLLGNLVINSYLAASDANGTSSDGTAGRVSMAYRGTLWNSSAMYKRVSDDFDPGVGFVRRRAMQQWFATTGVHARPALPHIQEVNPYIETEYITDLSGALETRAIKGGLQVNLQPDGQFTLEYEDQYDRLDRPFPIYPGVTIPAGAYSNAEAQVRVQSSQARPLSVSAQYATGDFYDGTRRAYGGDITWRVRYDLSLQSTLTRNNVALPGGSFLADVAAFRARYAWSTRLFGSAFVQYNTQAKSLVTNARVNFRYAPLSDVFLVYTERTNTLTDVRNERSVALKVTRMLQF
ncbi:MAG: DUF5916 domain-containing protein [Gemmatimonadaceae bacterium]